MSGVLKRFAVFTIGALAAFPGVAVASGNNGAIDETDKILYNGPDTGEMLGSLVWLMVALAIVILLILFVIKWLSKRSRTWGVNRSMRSLGGVALGQNSSVQVVEIAGTVYIVGVGDSVSLLDKVDNPERVAEVLDVLDKEADAVWGPKDFANLLGKWKGNRNVAIQKDAADNEASSFQQMLDSKLGGQSNHKQQLEQLLKNQKSHERLMDDEK